MGSTRFSMPRIVGAVVLVVLVIALALSTNFVTPKELASMGPERFDPLDAAAGLFDKANQQLPGDAAPLPDLVTGLQKDVEGTAKDLSAAHPNDTTYLFPTSGEGTVVSTTDQAIELKVDGVPAETTITIAVGAAVNGTVLRDMMAFEFGDAPNQTAYQQVGDELKKLVGEQVGTDATKPKKGATLRFVGVVSVTDTGSPQPAAKPISVQPLTLESGS